jgi:N-acyl homoserine lactone hydrolase
MRLYCFSTGQILCPLEGIKMNQFQDDPFVIPVPWYAIDHPAALVVIDGGNPAAVAVDAVGHWGATIEGCEVQMDPSQACIPTLRRHGLKFDRPTYLLQTHLHSDHVGALAAISEFNNPRVVVTRREYEYAMSPDWHLAGDYVRSDFDHPDADWHFVEDDDDNVDVLGDGSIRMHHTPGHSVGHISVEVNLPETGSILLTGDAAYTRDHWEERALPGIVASTVDAVRSVRKLKEIASRNDAEIIFGHDIEQWQSEIRRGPEYYS